MPEPGSGSAVTQLNTYDDCYIGSFSDVALATKAANTQLQAGADVMTGTSQMVVGPIGMAQVAGVPWFGTQADQTELASDIVVVSQVYD